MFIKIDITKIMSYHQDCGSFKEESFMRRVNSFDTMKFFGIFAVIVIHSGLFYNYLKPGPNHYQATVNIIARFAVPFFFMVSGYLFCKKIENRSLGDHTLKYLKRLLIPFIKWNLIYFIFAGLAWYWWQEPSAKEFILYGTGFSIHLWYLMGLIQAVLLLLPFILMKKEKIALLISGTLLIFGLLGQSYKFLYKVPIFTAEGDYRNGLFFGFFFLTAGYLFAKEKIDISKKIGLNAFIGSIICLFLSVIEGNYLWVIREKGTFSEYYIFTIPAVILLFIFCLGYKEFGKDTIFEKIGLRAEKIYLNHILVIGIYWSGLWAYGYNNGGPNALKIVNNFGYQLIFAPVMFTIIVTITFAIEKIFNSLFSKERLKNSLNGAIFLNIVLLISFTAHKIVDKKPILILNDKSVEDLIFILLFAVATYLIANGSFTKKTFVKDGIIAIKMFVIFFILSKLGYLFKIRYMMNPKEPNMLLHPAVTYQVLIILAVIVTLLITVFWDKIYKKSLNKI